MRIVIDMQGAQTASRRRGIGRYSKAFAQAIVRNRGTHDVWLALNGLFPETIMPIRDAFADLLPRDRIRVWEAPGPVAVRTGDAARRRRARHLYEAFLASLDPDIVHVTSLIEGFVDEAVTDVGALGAFPTSVTLYDLIPLHDPERFLQPDPSAAAHYRRKLEALSRADLLLAISNFTARDARARLELRKGQVVVVSCAADAIFGRRPRDTAAETELFSRLRMKQHFVLTSGTVEPHKNLGRLFEAVARLPAAVWRQRSLVLVGSVDDRERGMLQNMAARAGLGAKHLVITGYVSDDDLVRLYATCDLMVVPSLDEGFGLPALEAMACGAPTIGSRAASVPEIIGRDDALFDPTDVADMMRLIRLALDTPTFRETLRTNAAERVPLFSWNETARRALSAMEACVANAAAPAPIARQGTAPSLPTLAFVSPLPPDRTGIADYSAELLPALAAHYDITLISRGHRSFSGPGTEPLDVRSPDWLRKNAGGFDRILYQFGNSPFHDYMLVLARDCPGTIVLHDFYLSSLLAWQELIDNKPGAWAGALYESHGYVAVQERFADVAGAMKRYPANLGILREEDVIVHSEHARALGRDWLGASIADRWKVAPQLKLTAPPRDKAAARRQLRIPPEAFLVCSFGMMAPSKLNLRLIEAFAASRLAAEQSCHLCFVGQPDPGAYGEEIRRTIKRTGLGTRIELTDWADAALYDAYLAAADVAVQLRTDSRGETSRAILDSMAAGLPTIVNAHGSAAEIPADAAMVISDDFGTHELAAALENLFEGREGRDDLGRAGRDLILRAHSPAVCAARYAAAIEAFHVRSQTGMRALADALAAVDPPLNGSEVKALAVAVAKSIPARRRDRVLFLDLTETALTDRRTGIERATRALALALIRHPPKGYRVEPVVLSDADHHWHYRFASAFALDLLGCPADALREDIAEPTAGDIILTLDFSGQRYVAAAGAGLYRDLERRGVRTLSVVYDLLAIALPQHFPERAGVVHEEWLQAAAAMNGVIGISRAVADDVRAWIGEKGAGRSRRHRVGWFHLGADIDGADPTRGMPPDAAARLADFAARPTFLMVGTIEPRKGHLQAIAAFDLLWRAGVDVNLVVVGAQGWTALPAPMRRTIPEILARLSDHQERNRRLFWLEGISDEYLEAVYAASSCLLAASEGEGFGLPLIEAARHHIPILARDIPVFREVAGGHAAYFSGLAPVDLAEAVKAWLSLHRDGRHPRSDEMPWQTWAESARQIAGLIAEWEQEPAPT